MTGWERDVVFFSLGVWTTIATFAAGRFHGGWRPRWWQ